MLPRDRLWCIYVAAASARNFAIARAHHIWGAVDADRFRDVRTGDAVLFVEHLRFDVVAGVKGYPRVPLECFRGVARSCVEGTVTTSQFEDGSRIWPDGVYPYRFRFAETHSRQAVRFDSSQVPSHVLAAVRLSALKQGRPVLA